MPSNQEKAAFSERLSFALRKSSKPVKGATDLARLFNLQHCTGPGLGVGISVQSTHKWLTGRAIPTPDKIKTLAQWLGVSAHWLHYGAPPDPPETSESQPFKSPSSPEALVLAKKITALPEHQRYLVAELVTQLYGKRSE